jgi:NRPS condensation-like uncharacterized protein
MTNNIPTQSELPVSVGQRMMWLMDHYQGRYGSLNCPIIIGLKGKLDKVRLIQAWQLIIDQVEVYRTRFIGKGQKLRRYVVDKEIAHIKEITLDISNLQETDLNLIPELNSVLREELRQHFDLNQPLYRVILWRLTDELNVLCINQHHLITDAVSCGLVSQMLGQAYEQQVLPKVPYQFSNFVEWEQTYLNSREYHNSIEFWQQSLKNVQFPKLPRRDRGISIPLAQDTITLYREHIDSRTEYQLKNLAKANNTSLYNVLLSAFMMYLHRLTGQSDLAVATLLANRTYHQDVIGFLSNMVILRTRINQNSSIHDVISELRTMISGAIAHQSLPYQLLPAGTVSLDSIGDVVFQLFPTDIVQLKSFTSLQALAIDPPNGLARRFDLDLALIPSQEGIRVIMAASDLRFRPHWAARFLKGYIALLLNITGQYRGLSQ